MTFQGTYIGYGIMINISELVDIFKSEKAGIKLITNYGFNSYDKNDDMQDISEIYDSLANCARNNKIFGLDLCVLQRPHDDQHMVYVGDFILISDDLDINNLINNVDLEKLQNLTNSTFNKFSFEYFNKKAELISISIGCHCCT
jgi:hypothetical protein